MKVRDITNLATRAIFNTKVTEIENKIPDITGSLTTPGFNRLTKICFDTRMKEANILASKSQVDSGHLKTPGTQMGYLFGWLSKLMTRPFFGQFWLAKDVSTRLPVCHFIYKKTVNFLRSYLLFLI